MYTFAMFFLCVCVGVGVCVCICVCGGGGACVCWGAGPRLDEKDPGEFVVHEPPTS